MKKSFIVFILLISLLLTSCTYCEEGVENFSIYTSTHSLSAYLIPEKIIENFEYINADYHWICDEPFIGYRVCERAIFYFQYDENVYEEAKRYTLENMMLSDTVTEVYGNYIFYDNLKGNDDFPNKFWRVAYNDNNHTLVFVAFYVSVELYDEAKLAKEDWGAFLEKYYGEWYSFEE